MVVLENPSTGNLKEGAVRDWDLREMMEGNGMGGRGVWWYC